MSGQATFGPHIVATHGATSPDAPLVVLLHGRGSNEQEIISLAPHLPGGIEYAAVRAPIAEGGGFAWFANRGIGRPVAESLADTMAWFRAWLDDVAPAGRQVIVVGFSGGGAFAGGLALSDPARFSGAGVLFATLPFDAGVAVTTGRLAHLPVFVAQGDQDHVIPAELLSRTWRYLLEDSGAPVVAHRTDGGHGLTMAVVASLGRWIAERLTYATHHPVPAPGRPELVSWATLPDGALPIRSGPTPEITWRIPQQQMSQNAPADLQERLASTVAELEGVSVGPSHISVPGARGFTMPDGGGDDQAFLVPSVREFAHLHPREDGSLHVALPPAHAADLVAKGWGRAHPLAGSRLTPGFVMVFGPRDEDELTVVQAILRTSYHHARGGVVPT
ncbi:luciferase family protein [Janibacter sp. G1551]|uniref:luciferase domain-containing protein n=1 Tax=Janibacter sp. G1551 TaxID=3420440 RepID=UPI003CFF282D